jgi:DMSO/TMAO reductase YedYZ molybdopterin-dependent catalytic subunit
MKHIFKYIILFTLCSGELLAQKAQADDDTPYITDKIDVMGLVENPFTITIESIKKMKVKEGKNANITDGKGEVKKQLKTFKGVLLKDILLDAKVKMERNKDRGKFIVVVSASDGYTVIFSYNELMYSAAAENTYILFEENGTAIKQDGKFVVFCTTDTISGPRHVKWVKSIDIRKID